MPTAEIPWYRELTRYHWFVFLVAALGWLFDTMDQQLFTLARRPAMTELMQAAQPELAASDPRAFGDLVTSASTEATAIFLIGWAVGGIGFGILGDRIGRARTMVWTILVYSVFTGFSAFAQNFFQFGLFRFLTGLGVGGEFAVGVALVAEVMPDRARPFALGLLQALSAVGNITAALISISLGQIERQGALEGLTIWGQDVTAWRLMFLIGTLPALLAILIRRKLKEPERWQRAAGQAMGKERLGSLTELFGDPRWRKRAFVGLVLAFSGVVGLWGVGFFSVDLVRVVFEKDFVAQGQSPEQIKGSLSLWAGISSMMLNLGAFFGIYAFSRVTHYTGRKPAFAVSFVAAGISTAAVFWFLNERTQIFWMMPIMGFCQLAVFGGYAIYFPELFPTRLRSTGTSFCYNVGRLVAALGPFVMGKLTSDVFTGSTEERLRLACVTMCSVFLIGLLALPFAPETKGQPLPD